MSLGVYNSVAFRDAAGLAAVAPAASVEVRREDTAALAAIFSDVAGATPLGNPFLADSSGRFTFYAAGIALGYRVTTTLGADVTVVRNVAIGSAMYLDADAVGGGGDVSSVAGRTGDVVLVKADVGLTSVDDTSDAGKPVSTAQATALAAKAPLASPALTGVPTAPTAAPGTNTTQISTTGFVKAAIDVVLGGVAAAYDTLVEIAAAIALKADIASPALTGNPTAPTQAAANNSTRLATTAYVDTADALKAPLASPALTGNPTAPTQAPADNTTKIATTAYADAAATAAAAGGSSPVTPLMFNGRFNARVTANTLIFEILTNAGAAPSAGDPVLVAFRDATLTSGAWVLRTLTAALSITIPDTALLGTVAGVAARLYGVLADEAGAVRIGAYNPLSGVNLIRLNENDLITSTLVSTAADLAQTIYTNDAVAACACRVIGYCEISEAVAGTWATAPTKVHTLKPGDRRTGDVVQSALTATGAVATGTTVLPWDDTIPQIGEGNEFMTVTITPNSASNVLEVDWLALLSNSVLNQLLAALFRDATANALAVTMAYEGTGATQETTLPGSAVVLAAAATATTFRLRGGGNVAGTTTFNGTAAARRFGGVSNSFLRVKEIFA